MWCVCVCVVVGGGGGNISDEHRAVVRNTERHTKRHTERHAALPPAYIYHVPLFPAFHPTPKLPVHFGRGASGRLASIPVGVRCHVEVRSACITSHHIAL